MVQNLCQTRKTSPYYEHGTEIKAESKTEPVSLTWLVGDSTVPKGWKVAQNQNGLRLNRVCSPDGVEFLNRRLALKQLIKNGGLEDTVEEMQGFLVVEGWMKDNHLPKHWRLKVKIFKSQSRNLILSPEGSVFDGVSAAVRCMKTTGNYSVREMEEVKELLNQTLRICIQVQFSQRYGQIKDRRPNFFLNIFGLA